MRTHILKNNNNNNNIPDLDSRVEVYFTSGNKGWYRGTYIKEKKGKKYNDAIYFDDGDSQSIENWDTLIWRYAKSTTINNKIIKSFYLRFFYSDNV